MKKNANKGFSLVELIIVIAIMAVLIGVLAPQFIKHVENSRQSTDLDNVTAVKTAIEAAVADETIKGTDATVTINVNGNKATVTSTDTTGLATALSEVGLSSEINMKSSGWPTGDHKFVYSINDYKWTPVSCENTKGKKNNMNSIFE